MSRFEQVAEESIHQGAVVRLVSGTFRAPDGTTFHRDIVRHPGAVAVVPVHLDDTVTLVRQYRAAVDRELLEIPAGKLDVPGEPPEETAARELAEEVGLRAGRLELVAEFFNSPGFCDERGWVFEATSLATMTQDLQGVEERHMTVERVDLAAVPAMIADGRICDAKTIIGLTQVLIKR